MTNTKEKKKNNKKRKTQTRDRSQTEEKQRYRGICRIPLVEINKCDKRKMKNIHDILVYFLRATPSQN